MSEILNPVSSQIKKNSSNGTIFIIITLVLILISSLSFLIKVNSKNIVEINNKFNNNLKQNTFEKEEILTNNQINKNLNSTPFFDMKIKSGEVNYNNLVSIFIDICNDGDISLEELYNLKNKSDYLSSEYEINFYTENKILGNGLILTGLKSPYDQYTKLKNGACSRKGLSFPFEGSELIKSSNSLNVVLDSGGNYFNNDLNLSNNKFVLSGNKVNYYDLWLNSFGVENGGLNSYVLQGQELNIVGLFQIKGIPTYFKETSSISLDFYVNDILVKTLNKKYLKSNYYKFNFPWIVDAKKGPLNLKIRIRDNYEVDLNSENNILEYNLLVVN